MTTAPATPQALLSLHLRQVSDARWELIVMEPGPPPFPTTLTLPPPDAERMAQELSVRDRIPVISLSPDGEEVGRWSPGEVAYVAPDDLVYLLRSQDGSGRVSAHFSLRDAHRTLAWRRATLRAEGASRWELGRFTITAHLVGDPDLSVPPTIRLAGRAVVIAHLSHPKEAWQ